jgi:hypothetical protein
LLDEIHHYDAIYDTQEVTITVKRGALIHSIKVVAPEIQEQQLNEEGEKAERFVQFRNEIESAVAQIKKSMPDTKTNARIKNE